MISTSIPSFVASAPATCGELVQAPRGGGPLQITCPIEIRSVARARLLPEAALFNRGGHLVRECARSRSRTTGPEGFAKARRAVTEAVRRWGGGGRTLEVALRSPAARGKGLGSSSADILAATAAAAGALGHDPSPEELAAVALSVEPTDGTMIRGVALFDHREGRVREALGPPPPMRVLVLDVGGAVDSVAFNAARGRRWDGGAIGRWGEAFNLVIRGIRTGDLEAVGRGATLSARLHQAVLPKPHLPDLARLVREWGGVGINVAHSGTVMGLLFPDEPGVVATARDRVRHRFPALRCLGSHRIVEGGVQVEAVHASEAFRAPIAPDEVIRYTDPVAMADGATRKTGESPARPRHCERTGRGNS